MPWKQAIRAKAAVCPTAWSANPEYDIRFPGTQTSINITVRYVEATYTTFGEVQGHQRVEKIGGQRDDNQHDGRIPVAVPRLHSGDHDGTKR